MYRNETTTRSATALAPHDQPGRSTRKVKAFGAEMTRLQAQGYTCEAIRKALAEAGVQVSRSTVWRELGKQAIRRPEQAATGGANAEALSPLVPTAPASTAAPVAMAADKEPDAGRSLARSGREVAEAFMRGRITNPLIRDKSKP